MSRFKRAYPRNIYIRQGPGPSGAVAPAITLIQQPPHLRTRVGNAARVGPHGAASGGVTGVRTPLGTPGPSMPPMTWMGAPGYRPVPARARCGPRGAVSGGNIGRPPIYLVQSQTATGTSTASLTVTMPVPVTPGNTLIVCWSGDASTSIGYPSSVTIGGSADNFQAALRTDVGIPSQQILGHPNVGVRSATIVINLSGETGTAWNTAYAYEVAGLATTGIIDQTAGTGAALEATVTTWSSGATPQTLQASEFWAGIAGTYWTSPETITGQAGPWTNLPAQATTSPSDLQVVSGYQITGTTGQATYSGTSGGAELWNASVVTFARTPITPRPVSLLQTEGNGNGGSLTLAVSFPAPVTAGNLAVIAVSALATTGTAPTISSVTFSGSTMATAVAYPATGTSPTAGLYYLAACPPGLQTITVTCTGSVAADTIITANSYEFNVTTVAPLDRTAKNTATGTSWTSGATGTTANQVDVAVGLYGAPGAAATTQTGPAGWVYSSGADNVSTSYQYMIAGYQFVAALSTATFAGTSSASELYEALVATFGTTPPATPSRPAPFVARSPARARARIGNNLQPGDGYASRISTPPVVLSQPRPFIARNPVRARAVCGPRPAPSGGVASPVSTPQGYPSNPAPRPVIQHLPPHRAKVGPGTYLAVGRPGVQTPLGFQSQPAPRPVIVHVPAARARLGLHGQAAGGVPSAVSTPLGSPSQPAPRPQIQHVPPHRAVWRGLAAQNYPPAAAAYRAKPFIFRSPLPARARLGNSLAAGDGYPSSVITPLGSLPAPRKVPIFPPKVTRARTGPAGAPGAGVASSIVTPPFVTFTTA